MFVIVVCNLFMDERERESRVLIRKCSAKIKSQVLHSVSHPQVCGQCTKHTYTHTHTLVHHIPVVYLTHVKKKKMILDNDNHLYIDVSLSTASHPWCDDPDVCNEWHSAWSVQQTDPLRL